MNKHERLKKLVKDFFRILEIREESSNGNVFSPVFISSVRVMLTKELSQILPEMKRLANE